jgi:hypothetical protein
MKKISLVSNSLPKILSSQFMMDCWVTLAGFFLLSGRTPIYLVSPLWVKPVKFTSYHTQHSNHFLNFFLNPPRLSRPNPRNVLRGEVIGGMPEGMLKRKPEQAVIKLEEAKNSERVNYLALALKMLTKEKGMVTK